MKSNGFTIIEVLIAIFVILVGLLGAFSVINQSLSASGIVSSRLVAAYLAQEGIEIIRNIRDTNWLQAGEPLKTSPWDNGLPDGNWQVDYTTVTLLGTDEFEQCGDSGYNCEDYDGDFLKLNDSGFYNYSLGTPTKFKRKITLAKEGEDVLKVSVLVEWELRQKSYQLSAQEKLYNWK